MFQFDFDTPVTSVSMPIRYSGTIPVKSTQGFMRLYATVSYGNSDSNKTTFYKTLSFTSAGTSTKYVHGTYNLAISPRYSAVADVLVATYAFSLTYPYESNTNYR